MNAEQLAAHRAVATKQLHLQRAYEEECADLEDYIAECERAVGAHERALARMHIFRTHESCLPSIAFTQLV
jgi:hypothetical protein